MGWRLADLCLLEVIIQLKKEDRAFTVVIPMGNPKTMGLCNPMKRLIVYVISATHSYGQFMSIVST